MCAFLFGAAAGGYLFGLFGDRFGRSKALAASILCYSAFSVATYFISSAPALLVLRFLTCVGIGGVWPNAIALLTEAWGDVSRPILSGILGTAVNVGILAFATLTLYWYVTIDDWRWTMLAGGCPLIVGLFAWLFLPESPRWLALRDEDRSSEGTSTPVAASEIFRPPILKTTIVGILLATIPLFGGWGVSNWASAWASEVGDRQPAVTSSDGGVPEETASENESPEEEASQAEAPAPSDPTLKSKFVIDRSWPGSISSLLGGALAYWLGRKRTYFLLCVSCFICTQFLFRVETPTGEDFRHWTRALGFFSGFFFGWLPLCLPELFTTRVRSVGAGVSFNWGRILTGIGVLVSAAALKQLFEGRYADVGIISGYIYAVGLLVILLAPDTSKKRLDD